jgi:hypothetical protein
MAQGNPSGTSSQEREYGFYFIEEASERDS